MPTDKMLEENQARRERLGYAPNPFCLKCRGAGFVYPLVDGQPDYRKTIPCDAENCLLESKAVYQKTNQYLAIRGLSERLQTFEKFRKRAGTLEAFCAFRNLARVDATTPFLLCYGETGNGKTFLCQAALKVLNGRGIVTNYYQVPRLLSILRDAIETNEVDGWVNYLCEMGGLILDDFGSESISEWGVAKLQEVIDVRWTKKLVTILTTNKDLDALREISPRIFSRMCDKELSVVIHNQGGDYRLEKRD